MDAAQDDKDVILQRASGELLKDFEDSLHPFLYNPRGGRLRRRARISEMERLNALLDNFQELPQLLDKHLQRLVAKLADAFLASISETRSKSSTTDIRFLVPLRRAISRLLYTLCKVRGEKVIVQCLSSENKYIEMLLSAIEKGTLMNNDICTEPTDELWNWDERYITLLWLSHLIIAPFDLKSLSSDSSPSLVFVPYLPGLQFAANVPDVPLRSISLAFRYLFSSGKEKDSAKTLLVRVVLRKDMQELGLLHSLLMWAISALQSIDTKRDIHFINGVLSFLSAVLKSSMDTPYMDLYLISIFQAVEGVKNRTDIENSAVSIKLAVKIFRSIALLTLRPSFTSIEDNIVGDAVGLIFPELSNHSTPIRLAASKALSVIMLKVKPEDASRFVSGILELLEYSDDLSTWHGQILTLSHLLYRHSAPSELLSEIICLILKALSFKQKTLSGIYIGDNVRDAANFGIWALARRYSTTELKGIKLNYGADSTIQTLATHLVVSACLDPAGNIRRGSSAALQELIGRHPGTIIEALNLVQIVDYHAVALRSRGILEVAVSASLLSYNTHSVCKHTYGKALLLALRDWRGIGDTNIVTRRNCAEAFRRINFVQESHGHSNTYANPYDTIFILNRQIENLNDRETNERHGLLLFLSAAILEYLPLGTDARTALLASSDTFLLQANSIFRLINDHFQQMAQGRFRRPELIAEALCCLAFHSFRLYGMFVMLALEKNKSSSVVSEFFTWLSNSKTRNVLMFEEKSYAEHMVTEALERSETTNKFMMMGENIEELSNHTLSIDNEDTEFRLLVEEFLDESPDIDHEIVGLWSACARRLFFWSSMRQRRSLIDSWLEHIRPSVLKNEVNVRRDRLFFSAAWIAYSLDPEYRDEIYNAIHLRWRTSLEVRYNLELRIAMVACLATDIKTPATQIIKFWKIISDGLDDYQIDQIQGDVGSRVRLEAIKSAAILFSTELEWNQTNEKAFSTIFGKLLRLCLERLDKVRVEAKKAILSILVSSPETSLFEQSSVSSYAHFRFMLDLQTTDRQIITPKFQWRPSWTDKLLEGYVTSAKGGSEDLTRVSRHALIDFCEKDFKNRECIGPALVRNLKTHHLTNDRLVIPTLEIVALLLDMGLIYKFYEPKEYRILYNLIVKEAFRSKEIPKLMAAAKCFGRLALSYPNAIDRLLTFLWHNYPKVRMTAMDELWDLGITCVKSKDCKNMTKESVLGTEDKPSEFGQILYKECVELGFKNGDILKQLGKWVEERKDK